MSVDNSGNIGYNSNIMTNHTKEIYMEDANWNDLFGAFFDKVEMTDQEKEEFIMDFYHMDDGERSTMIEVMAEVIVGDMDEDDFQEGFQSFLEMWEGWVVDTFKECEENEFPCLIPDNGIVLN